MRSTSPVLGDLDRDGRPEIIVASGTFPSYTTISAYRDDGTPVVGYPKQLSGRVFRAFNEPVLADIDGDTFPEIVMGFEGVAENFEELHALRHDGSEEPGWPKLLRYIDGYGITGSSVAGDFDDDGEVDLAVSSNAYWVANSDIYVWNLQQPLHPAAMPWPTQRHDNQRTACLGDVPTGVAEKPSCLPAPLVSLAACPNPFRDRVSLQLTTNGLRAGIRIYDVTGKLVREFVVPRSASGIPHSVYWDGADLSCTQVGSGIYFVQALINDKAWIVRLVRER